MGGHEHPGGNPTRGQSPQGMCTRLHLFMIGSVKGDTQLMQQHCNGQEHCVLLENRFTGLWQCVSEAYTLDSEC